MKNLYLKKNEDIRINYEKDKNELITGVIVHDVKAKELHYVDYTTFDKLSVKYDGKRINLEAQEYVNELTDKKGLQHSITTFDEVIKTASLCDGKNAVTIKPVDINFVENTAYDLTRANDSAIFQVLVDERNQGKLRYSNNPNIEYLDGISTYKEQFAMECENKIKTGVHNAKEDNKKQKEKELKKLKAKTKEDV